MFERFSDRSRRVIFFARYQAGRLGGSAIGTEHLLLGLLQENSWLVGPLLAAGHTVENLERETEKLAGSKKEKVPTSVDMPLAEPAKMALTYAAEESDRLLSATIDVHHLLLGILRTKGSKAANLLGEFGLSVDEVRLKFAQGTVGIVEQPFSGVVCDFYGIEIRFDVGAQSVPSFYAQYKGHVALVGIDPVKVIKGELPARAESMVLEWATTREGEIGVAWKAATEGKTPPRIPPLE